MIFFYSFMFCFNYLRNWKWYKIHLCLWVINISYHQRVILNRQKHLTPLDTSVPTDLSFILLYLWPKYKFKIFYPLIGTSRNALIDSYCFYLWLFPPSQWDLSICLSYSAGCSGPSGNGGRLPHPPSTVSWSCHHQTLRVSPSLFRWNDLLWILTVGEIPQSSVRMLIHRPLQRNTWNRAQN